MALSIPLRTVLESCNTADISALIVTKANSKDNKLESHLKIDLKDMVVHQLTVRWQQFPINFQYFSLTLSSHYLGNFADVISSPSLSLTIGESIGKYTGKNI